MNKFLIIALLLLTSVSLAQLPSWGMTEQQYRMPNRAAKLANIGKEAIKNKWQLKVVAPQSWHSNIRAGLTQDGEKNVMLIFQDSLHKSISITAGKAKHMGQTVSSSQTQVVQKQVVIEDKPEIDTTVERPEFDDEFMSGKPVVAKVELDMALPKTEHQVSKSEKPKPVAKKAKAEKVVTPEPAPKPVVQSKPAPVKAEAKVVSNEEATSEARKKTESYLRKRYAKNKQTNGVLPYARVTQEDDLYIKDGVVLVVREKNSRLFYYWMKETFDASTQAIKHKSQERYGKTEAAEAVKSSVETDEKEATESVERTSLVLTAVDDAIADQDVLRRDYIRNKAVKHAYSAERLKSGDLVYTRNNTVLVVRRLSRTNEIYFWLKGEVNVTENITMMRPNEFKIK